MQTSHYSLRGPNLKDPSVDRLAYRRTARQHVRSGSGEHTRYPPHFLFVTSLCLNNNNIGGKISMSPPLSHGLAGCLHIAWRRPSGATRDRHITRYRGSTYTFQQKDRQNDEQCDLPTFLFQMPHEPTAGSPVNILASPGSIDKSPCSTNRRLVHMQERPAF